VAAIAAIGIVISANVLRSCSLFLLETGSVRVPAFTHTAVGLVMFAGAALAILRLNSGRRESLA
jgi:hypothetical protein